jgi:hypothetical protein
VDRSAKLTLQESEAAESLIKRHFGLIEAAWDRCRRSGEDLLGVLDVDAKGKWFVGMSAREDAIDGTPALLQTFPQLSKSAWEAEPPIDRGGAIWLIVRSPDVSVCIRVHRMARLSPGGEG